MNNIKALKILNENLQAAIHDCDGLNPEYEQEQVKALQIAVNAVEKQIPKKPDFEGDGYDDNGNIIYDTWICPCCEEHYEVDYDNYKYCPNCGQALDWSDTE